MVFEPFCFTERDSGEARPMREHSQSSRVAAPKRVQV